MESKSTWWWKLLAGHRRSLLLGLGSTLLCSLAAAWVPFWSGKAVHALEVRRYGDSRHALVWMLLFTLVAGIGRYLMRNTLIGLSREIEKAQREEIYAYLMTRSFAFYERQRIGDLMSRIGDDVSTVRMATGPGFMSLLQTFSILPMTMALMLHTHVRLTFAVMLPFSFLALGFYLLSKKSHALQQKLQLVSSQLNTFSHETIQGEKVVQAFGLEGLRVGRFRELSEDQARLNIRQSSIFGAYGPMASLIGGAAALVLVAYGGTLVTRHELSLGDLTAFTGYLVALAWPVMSLGWSVNLFQRARAGQERIEQVLAAPDPAVPPWPGDEAPALPPAPAAIALSDGSFRFESGRGLGPISLKVASGGSLAIVGGIGSGKSILLQTLAGLRTIQEGRYEVDGQSLDDATLRRHWAGLGWVPQEAFLFSTSLRENLIQGRPGATEAEIWEVAEVVCLDDLIRRLPAGLDTVVGERGVVLSGGERQRTALARALLKKPRLLLMDDALSAVDAETESRILENLKGYLGRTTLVLATHRIFVAELCEEVLVMEQGRAIQFGTPAQLAEQQGLYARLKRLQSLEREILGRSAG
ncbi:MAG: ABC transporter ATP-binding protein [Holophagaceae bacterium]|nr:ABC transporter ATP-binding protein [Holophagaceae bacterium]